MKRSAKYSAVTAGGLVAVVLAAVGLVASGDVYADAAAGKTTATTSIPADLLDDAQQWATQDNSGKKLGGTIKVVGISGGAEGAILEQSYEPFEKATGVTVEYEGTHDANTIVATRIRANDAPDVYYAGTSGGLSTYLRDDALTPLNDVVDTKKMHAQYASQLVDDMTVGGKLYGVYGEIDSYGLWFNPKNYNGPKSFGSWSDLLSWAEQEADAGRTPFCMSLQQGSGTGAANTYLIENILLSKYGPDVTNEFAEGKLPFTAPQVKWAFAEFAKLAGSSDLIAGGPNAALSSPTAQMGAGLFTDPASCELSYYGEFGQNVFQTANPAVKAGEDTGFIPFPADGADGGQLGNGHVAYLMQDTAQSRAFMRYFASPEYQALLASAGEWTVANKDVSPSVLPNDVMRGIQEYTTTAKTTVLGSITQMNPVTLQAFYSATVQAMQKTTPLETILQQTEATRSSNADQ